MANSWQDDPDRSLQIQSAEGCFDAYVARRKATCSPAVVVLHEVLGVNEDMRMTCSELAAAGFIAICPDLFWRQERGVDLSPESNEQLRKGLALDAAFDLDAGVRDAEATVAAARTLEGASGKVGMIGFGLGGLLTFLTAARTQVDAAIGYRDSRMEDFLDEAQDIDSPFMMHVAQDDEFMSKGAQERIGTALARNSRIEVCNDRCCRHAFARHDDLHPDAAAVRAAHGRTFDFFNRHLR